jgi:hypothetical protein
MPSKCPNCVFLANMPSIRTSSKEVLKRYMEDCSPVPPSISYYDMNSHLSNWCDRCHFLEEELDRFSQ